MSLNVTLRLGMAAERCFPELFNCSQERREVLLRPLLAKFEGADLGHGLRIAEGIFNNRSPLLASCFKSDAKAG